MAALEESGAQAKASCGVGRQATVHKGPQPQAEEVRGQEEATRREAA